MEIVNFIKEYWQFISTVVLFIVAVAGVIIKKKPFFSGLYEELSKLIYFVEKAHPDYSGEMKLKEVLSLYHQTNGDSVSDKVLSRCVENLLSLPTKKGGLGREESSSK